MAQRKNLKAQPESTTTDAIEQELQGTSRAGGDTVVVCLNRAIGVRYRLKDNREITIPGNSCHLRGKEVGQLNTGGGFSMTTISRADWEEIKATYKDTALFKNGRIFAQDSRDNALAEARDKKDTRHGLEPTKGVQTKPVVEEGKG